MTESARLSPGAHLTHVTRMRMTECARLPPRAQVLDLVREDTPQLYALCGRGPQSSLRVLRHGLAVQELAMSELPGVPNAVWTAKKVFLPDHLFRHPARGPIFVQQEEQGTRTVQVHPQCDSVVNKGDRCSSTIFASPKPVRQLLPSS